METFFTVQHDHIDFRLKNVNEGGELGGAATSQEVLLARAVAVETAEEAAVDARRSFLKRASEGTRRPSLALPLVSEVIL